MHTWPGTQHGVSADQLNRGDFGILVQKIAFPLQQCRLLQLALNAGVGRQPFKAIAKASQLSLRASAAVRPPK